MCQHITGIGSYLGAHNTLASYQEKLDWNTDYNPVKNLILSDGKKEHLKIIDYIESVFQSLNLTAQ